MSSPTLAQLHLYTKITDYLIAFHEAITASYALEYDPINQYLESGNTTFYTNWHQWSYEHNHEARDIQARFYPAEDAAIEVKREMAAAALGVLKGVEAQTEGEWELKMGLTRRLEDEDEEWRTYLGQ